MVAAATTVKTTWGLIVDEGRNLFVDCVAFEGTGWASKTWIHKRCWLQQEAATVQQFLLGFGCKCQGGAAAVQEPVCRYAGCLREATSLLFFLSLFFLSSFFSFFFTNCHSRMFEQQCQPFCVVRIVGLFGERKAHRQRKSETVTNPKTLLQFSLTVAHPRTAAQRCLPPFLPTFSVSC